MLKKLFLYSFCAFVLVCVSVSCVNNSDKNEDIGGTTPPNPGSSVNLTAKDMQGTWEIYYLTKAIGQGGVFGPELRSPEFDGYTITFDGVKNYKEQDPEGGTLISGEYYIVGRSKDSIYFVFNYQGRDSSSYMLLPHKTDKFFTRTHAYQAMLNGQNVLVKDIELLRNVVTAPGQFDGNSGVGRLTLKPSAFIGNWKVTGYKQSETNQSGQMNPVNKGKEVIGTKYTFNSDGTFKMIDSIKKATYEGNFVISGDVLHLFYKVVENNKTITKVFDYWIKTQTENMFEIYSKGSTYENNYYQIKETSTIVTRVENS